MYSALIKMINFHDVMQLRFLNYSIHKYTVNSQLLRTRFEMYSGGERMKTFTAFNFNWTGTLWRL